VGKNIEFFVSAMGIVAQRRQTEKLDSEVPWCWEVAYDAFSIPHLFKATTRWAEQV
jgi:hypothetical protein